MVSMASALSTDGVTATARQHMEDFGNNGDVAELAVRRFGPRLPRLVEAALIRQAETNPTPETRPRLRGLQITVGAAAVFALGLWLGQTL